MYHSSVKLILALSIFFFALSFSNPIFPSTNITLFGDASLNSSSVILTKQKNCTTAAYPPPPQPLLQLPAATISTVGRAFYANPIRFLDPKSNATASFYSSFSFTITNTDSCPFGDGFAFLITPTTTYFSLEDGYMGLPPENEASPSSQDSYFAVEFDTNFDPYLENIRGSHIGIDVNNVHSLASVDVDLIKNGQEMTAWIEYRDSEKKIKVWVWYAKQNRPLDPILVTRIDLSKQFKEFMYVGFTASNGGGKGSSIHTVDKWRFKTFFGNRPPSNTTLMDIVVSQGGEEDCLLCPHRNTAVEIGSYNYHRPNTTILNLVLIFGGFAAAAILIAAVIVGFCVCLARRRRLRRAHREREMRRFRGGRMVPHMLSLNEIKSATNGFNQDKIIGEGASAVVYEGAIPSCGSVAVKRFNHENKYESSISQIPFNTEFATMVGCLRHRNLVQLQGWCCEKNELILVFERMPNGSLDKILHNRTNLTKFLTWERRLNILRGVASALIHLHEECENQIIHRDVKTCNILLDTEFNAKLGDFGLAEVYRRGSTTRYATVPAGTMGYLAPEYVFSGVPTVKTDVYSFGVVVLEVATGRRPVDESRAAITDYVWDLWEKGVICEAADANMIGGFERKEMEGVLMVGLLCAHPDCGRRPTMMEAARMLRWESPVPVLPAKKPTMRIQSVVPVESVSFDDETTPWSTPKTHFSRR
ncbi:hypothetical protein ABFS83_14G304700 [Erythranthe nasuta]